MDNSFSCIVCACAAPMPSGEIRIVFPGFSVIRIIQNSKYNPDAQFCLIEAVGKHARGRWRPSRWVSHRYRNRQPGSACWPCLLWNYWATLSEKLLRSFLSLLFSSQPSSITSRTLIRLNTTGNLWKLCFLVWKSIFAHANTFVSFFSTKVSVDLCSIMRIYPTCH